MTEAEKLNADSWVLEPMLDFQSRSHPVTSSKSLKHPALSPQLLSSLNQAPRTRGRLCSSPSS